MPLVASGGEVCEMQGGGGGHSNAMDDDDEADRVPGRRAAEHGVRQRALGPGPQASQSGTKHASNPDPPNAQPNIPKDGVRGLRSIRRIQL